MSIRILVTDSINDSSRDRLLADGYEIVKHHYEPEELGAALREYDAVVVRSATKIRKHQIDEAKGSRLKLILRAGVGVDNIDVAEAEAAGIMVRNTPLSASNAVAELTVGMLFACARKIVLAGTQMKEERWEKKALGDGFELMGKTLGVIGYGRIGQLVGRKAQALGMNVLSSVHRHKPEGCECETMHFVPMEELYRRSDAIALCTPGVGYTLINRETLAQMKDGVVIVNTSRGANVDEEALLEALESGKVSFAALDVWLSEKEPNWALAKHPHVVPTPHLGASTEEAQKKIGAEIVSVIEETLPIA